MKEISSFLKDHDNMDTGFFPSGTAHGVTTFDLRFVKPNTRFLTTAEAHTVEHILATALRSGDGGDNIVYFGPMGCRTGFYLLTANTAPEKARDMLIAAIEAALLFKDVPGSQKNQCGNYRDHDLSAAKLRLSEYLQVLKKRND